MHYCLIYNLNSSSGKKVKLVNKIYNFSSEKKDIDMITKWKLTGLYLEKYKNNLRKELPRIPLADNFDVFETFQKFFFFVECHLQRSLKQHHQLNTNYFCQ